MTTTLSTQSVIIRTCSLAQLRTIQAAGMGNGADRIFPARLTKTCMPISPSLLLCWILCNNCNVGTEHVKVAATVERREVHRHPSRVGRSTWCYSTAHVSKVYGKGLYRLIDENRILGLAA
jgi:hypothetical protein